MSEPSDAELAARYRPVIEAELAEINTARDVTSADRKPVELDQQSVGRLSRMDAIQGQAMAAAIGVRRVQRSAALSAALRRMEAHEFGWCASCGEFIGIRRLDVDPVVTTCIACAQ